VRYFPSARREHRRLARPAGAELTAPPAELFDVLRGMPRTDDYAALDSLLRR
jgi:hypothetical protein